MRLTIVQPNLVWENPQANLSKLSELLSATDHTDLIVLPEMFPTGFSMKPHDHFEEGMGPALSWMKELAAKKNAAVCGSVIVKEAGDFFNRLYFVKPEGETVHYDKRHLFTLAGEQKIYSRGSQRLIVKWKEWKIMPLVCYDLRFPVWCRNDHEADLQIFVANWPERRSEAWKTLLKARAIENMCCLAGVNRVGADGNDVMHSGDSAIYNEMGQVLAAAEPHHEQVITVKLDRDKIQESRKRFSFLFDRDKFEIKL